MYIERSSHFYTRVRDPTKPGTSTPGPVHKTLSPALATKLNAPRTRQNAPFSEGVWGGKLTCPYTLLSVSEAGFNARQDALKCTFNLQFCSFIIAVLLQPVLEYN